MISNVNVSFQDLDRTDLNPTNVWRRSDRFLVLKKKEEERHRKEAKNFGEFHPFSTKHPLFIFGEML